MDAVETVGIFARVPPVVRRQLAHLAVEYNQSQAEVLMRLVAVAYAASDYGREHPFGARDDG
jgi:hypothetical protein